MPTVVILPRASAQIIDVLDFTREEFGEAKYLESRELIRLALTTLEATPTAGKHRPEIHPTRGTYHIARPGRKARHLFLYRIRDVVKIARFSTTRWTCLASGSGNGNDT